MDDRLRPQSERNPGAADNDSAPPADPPESTRPTVVIVAGISDSIADVLGRFPAFPGHEVRLTITPGSALFLTAAEFRALKEASDRAGIVTTVETEDPLRRQLSLMFGLKLAPHERADCPSSRHPGAGAIAVVCSANSDADHARPNHFPANQSARPGRAGAAFEVRGANPPGPDSTFECSWSDRECDHLVPPSRNWAQRPSDRGTSGSGVALLRPRR